MLYRACFETLLCRRAGSSCRLTLAALLIAVLFPPVAVVIGAEPTPDQLAWFEREVRPLLARHCIGCHGPKKQESNLRLDHRDAALRGGSLGPALVPGSPSESLLMRAVRHEGDLKMPPDSRLKASEVATLEQWIREGAIWPASAAVNATRGGPITAEERQWWSFQPIAAVSVPDAVPGAPALGRVDRFIARRWAEEKIEPMPVAERRTLLRRVALDLTGLPPTLDELHGFLQDEGPDALARVIDRWLASPRYGERWGRHWLDVVRYADTAGDGADYPIREAFRYRDYVIQSFNADQPYDEFLREQVAGDILAKRAAVAGTISPEQFREKVTATGFLAISKRFGYNLNTEFQHLDIADSLEGIGRSVLGLSIGCARCHDHKYDPVNATDYYAWYGILASSQFTFPGGEELKQPRNLVPLVTPQEEAARQQQRTQELAKFDVQIAELTTKRATIAAHLPLDPAVCGFEKQTLDKPLAAPWFQSGPQRVTSDASSPFTHLFPVGTRGVRIEPGKPNDGIRLEFPPPRTAATAPRLYFNIDFRNVVAAGGDQGGNSLGSYRFYLGRGAIISMALECSVAAGELHVRNGGAWEKIRSLEPNVWYNLQLTIDLANKKWSGRVGRPDDWTEFADKALAPGWNGEIDTFFCDGIGHQMGPGLSRDLDNITLQPVPFAAPGSTLSPEELARHRDELARVETELRSVETQRTAVAIQPLFEMAYGVVEGKPINVKIQKRGEPDRLGDEVPRRNLEILGGDAVADVQQSSGRLDMAEWLTRPTNPLTPRVIVNRIWQWHFGAGLVATSSDFGTRGERPSHPELLDFLAREFLASGWSIKTLHRELMMTRVYQLSGPAGTLAAKNTDADAKNRLLWHFARRPLDAESIRDGMLALSGELNLGTAGPHPFPPLAQWNFTIHYPFSADYETNHRSVFQMVQRQRKHPYLSLFDGADPNISTAERLSTTTPTQALYLMNSPFVHRQAQAFARRILAAESDDARRARWAIESATAQQATDDDIQQALDFLSAYRERAGKAADEAAWSALARALLTSNAVLFVD